MILGKLFFAFCKIAIFSFGGAYSFLPLFEKEIVENYGWLSKTEFMDVLGISTIFPGAISVKYATYVGYKVAGMPGIFAASAGIFVPTMLLILGASGIYLKIKDQAQIKGALEYIRLAIFSMIIVVAFNLVGIKNLANMRNMIFISGFLILFALGKIHPAFLIIGAGIIGAILK